MQAVVDRALHVLAQEGRPPRRAVIIEPRLEHAPHRLAGAVRVLVSLVHVTDRAAVASDVPVEAPLISYGILVMALS